VRKAARVLAITAKGQNSKKHFWKKTLEANASVQLGRSVKDGWSVPWDKAVSRSHAELTCVGDQIEVRCLDNAKNAAVYNRRAVRQFTVREGEEFIIGDTTFQVDRLDDPRPATSDVKGRIEEIRERLAALKDRSKPKKKHDQPADSTEATPDPPPAELQPDEPPPSPIDAPATLVDGPPNVNALDATTEPDEPDSPPVGEDVSQSESHKDSDSIAGDRTSAEQASPAFHVAEQLRQKRAVEQAAKLQQRRREQRRSDLLLTNRLELPLEPNPTCPHCWTRFFPDETLWISEHPDLVGDPLLGEDAAQRFRPVRFKPGGGALDMGDYECHRLACPSCHLEIPKALFETSADIWSILGAPSCGKSYFLASMTHQLHAALPKHFGYSFGDIDPQFNSSLSAYRRLVFESDDPNKIVAIPKTELDGDLYNNVLVNGQVRRFPQPFLFEVKPLSGHPRFLESDELTRLLCLYDNAGEHFSPGATASNAPVTNHLAKSSVLFFLFDPTQDSTFRKMWASKSKDLQFHQGKVSQQETFVREAANRVRRITGCPQNTPHDRPLVVVVTKYDAWASALGQKPLRPCWHLNEQNESVFDMEYVESISSKVGAVLRKHAPDFVAAAESFCREVWFIPVSATGCSPEFDRTKQVFGVRPRDMKPRWVETPFLFALSRWMEGAALC